MVLSQKTVTNWGNYPQVTATITPLDGLTSPHTSLKQLTPVTIRGNGRSYGDASLGKQILSTLPLNKFLTFDTQQGLLTCQSGVLLSEILSVIVPQGWFLAITPGTKFVTLGGAISADVHGKNHHSEGSFSQSLIEFKLMDDQGEIFTCSRQENPQLFWATIGGMGLMGLILSATLQLKKIETAFIRQDSIQAQNLEEAIDLFESSLDWTYTVAWIDCLSKGEKQGRSLFLRGEHATIDELPSHFKNKPLQLPKKGKLTIPFNFPSWGLNPLTVKLFNEVYYHKQSQKQVTQIIDYDSYFYPLDGIHCWNRIYGKKGFIQYQFVLPKSASKEGLKKVLDKISDRQKGSFLTVLKLFGQCETPSLMSFPMEGYTLALDFKIQPDLWNFLTELDQIVLSYGGRFYLAKDSRMNYQAMVNYPHLSQFQSQINRKFTSALAERIGL